MLKPIRMTQQAPPIPAIKAGCFTTSVICSVMLLFRFPCIITSRNSLPEGMGINRNINVMPTGEKQEIITNVVVHDLLLQGEVETIANGTLKGLRMFYLLTVQEEHLEIHQDWVRARFSSKKVGLMNYG